MEEIGKFAHEGRYLIHTRSSTEELADMLKCDESRWNDEDAIDLGPHRTRVFDNQAVAGRYESTLRDITEDRCVTQRDDGDRFRPEVPELAFDGVFGSKRIGHVQGAGTKDRHSRHKVAEFVV
ncbi:hypothetical protein CFIO01_08061 [Colletotrichum fioriniae PJ7]|uniref:Uncharacterized protein n=1 Tax=Colletotrichum fioriniae PJ7 TaxID=1445577 RepID=A0A010R2Q5_9PEZI|nr:hypothetical protein CFIO01_08061 [Colletotrichum fioriniae PJ7]